MSFIIIHFLMNASYNSQYYKHSKKSSIYRILVTAEKQIVNIFIKKIRILRHQLILHIKNAVYIIY